MKIGISLNEVLRSHIEQFHYVYEKYKGEVEFDFMDVDSFDLTKHYDFSDISELNDFLYRQCSLEVFGHADQMKKNIFIKLNNFIMDIEDEGEHEIYIISREFNVSIPATLFFLSKMLCKARNIHFVQEYEEKWEGMDVLITANPITLAAKPENKIAIKIKAPYNENSYGDYTVEDVEDILDAEELNKILNL